MGKVREELEQELRQVRLRLGRAYAAFELVSDPDLLDAWLYEINAQQARYSYLLREYRGLSRQQPDREEVRV